MKILAPIAFVVLLAGCAEFGARAITGAQDAADATRDYIDEKTDRREFLRKELYAAEDAVIRCWQLSLMVEAGPEATKLDCSNIEDNAEKLATYIEQAYPTLTDLVEDVKRLKQAIREARED